MSVTCEAGGLVLNLPRSEYNAVGKRLVDLQERLKDEGSLTLTLAELSNRLGDVVVRLQLTAPGQDKVQHKRLHEEPPHEELVRRQELFQLALPIDHHCLIIDKPCPCMVISQLKVRSDVEAIRLGTVIPLSHTDIHILSLESVVQELKKVRKSLDLW